MKTTLVLTLLVGVVYSDSTCNTVKWQGCTVDVFTQFFPSITSDELSNIWKDYHVLNSLLLSEFAKEAGADAIVNACNGLTQFFHCMYGNEYCYSLQNLLADPTVTEENAYAIRGVLSEYANFECGAGLGTMLLGNLQCVQEVNDESFGYLQSCTATYLTNVQHDVARACSYANLLTTCYSAPFHLAECKNEAGRDTWVACTSQKRFVLEQFPNCNKDVQCAEQPFTTKMSEYLAKYHVKNADGTHNLTLPDTFQKVNGELKKVPGKTFTLKL